MQETEINQKIRSYIVENFLFGQDDGFDEASSLLEKGVLDSTSALELVAHLESTFGLRVEANEMVPENLDSISALCSFVKRKIVAGAKVPA